MLVIGIVGGVASGKSLVADQFRQLGAVVLDADSVAHEVLEEPQVRQAIRRRWDDRPFDSAGRVDRKALANIVFASSQTGSDDLAYLEHITHPRIGEKLERQIAAANAAGAIALVLDAAVLFKVGWDRFCDRIIFVDTPRSVRLRRVSQRGWNTEQFDRREASQLPLDEKRAKADTVIDNSATPEETQKQILDYWHRNVIEKK